MLVQLVVLCLVIAAGSTAGQHERCCLPKEIGLCRARFPRFYYNFNTEKCELFFYGGCRGNANNFKTREECSAACHDAMCWYDF